ncbi:MAG: hypothetical protein LBV49_10845 [Azonexus sp.]|nr:hypothetical protein [Azonexus sp.]
MILNFSSTPRGAIPHGAASFFKEQKIMETSVTIVKKEQSGWRAETRQPLGGSRVLRVITRRIGHDRKVLTSSAFLMKVNESGELCHCTIPYVHTEPNANIELHFNVMRNVASVSEQTVRRQHQQVLGFLENLQTYLSEHFTSKYGKATS